MKKPITIAIYSGDIPSTTFIERLLKGLASNGQVVYVFGFLKKKVRYTNNIKVVGYSNSKIGKGLHYFKYSALLSLFRPKDKLKLDQRLKAESKFTLLRKVKYYPVLWHQPDIFHVQWAKGLADWMWVQDFGIKLVLSLRGAHINYSPIADVSLANMYREHFSKVDGFHAVSKAIGLEAEKYGANQEHIKVVYSGLNMSNLKLEPELQNDVFKILSVGRPHWIKGYTYVLDACKILKNQKVSFQYTIVGAANAIELQYQIHDLGLQDNVFLLPSLSFDAVQHQMQNSNLLLLPSVEEGIANVVLEAMSLGTLVLTTDCGGMREVIQDEVNGFICPIRDSQAIADKISGIKGLPIAVIEDIIIKAKETIGKQHSEVEMVNGMCQLYQEVLGN